MPALKYRCPATSQEVTSAIETTAHELEKLRHLLVAVACPHCAEGHRIPANQMFFAWPAEPAGSPRERNAVG